VTAAIVALGLAFGVLQAASYALNAQAAAPGTLPTRVPPRFGLDVYRALDRVAPAPFVLSTLAEQSLERNDTQRALRYAVRLPASPTRDDLLGRIAAARGERELALEYFLAAPDVALVSRAVAARASRSPAAGYELERVLNARLALLTTHPDDVAEAYFQMGQLANRQAWREVPDSKRQGFWLFRGMRAFQAAVNLAPLSEKYLIAAGNQAMLLGDLAHAHRLFVQAVGADPASANAAAGVGVIAYQQGDFATARAYLRRARAIDPHALMVRSLERFLSAGGPSTQ
jgi:tetratricopeptide (TPR) repeat protein